jgi:hypothetical protein
MKKGKTVKLTGFRNCKVSYGTVDSKEFKSLYINLQTWVEPKIHQLNWDRVVSNTTREVKHSIHENLNIEQFNEYFIVDLDLRTSGIQLKKKSFMNLEINLFIKEEVDFKSPKLKRIIKKLIKDLHSDILVKNKYFKFYLTKNGNNRVEKIKTQTI